MKTSIATRLTYSLFKFLLFSHSDGLDFPRNYKIGAYALQKNNQNKQGYNYTETDLVILYLGLESHVKLYSIHIMQIAHATG